MLAWTVPSTEHVSGHTTEPCNSKDSDEPAASRGQRGHLDLSNGVDKPGGESCRVASGGERTMTRTTVRQVQN